MVHLTNQIQDPASVVVWSLDQKWAGYSFDDVCQALESTYGSSGSKENLRAEQGGEKGRASRSWAPLFIG